MYSGDSIMSRGAWSNIQAGSERTSITCLLSLQQSASSAWSCCKCICYRCLNCVDPVIIPPYWCQPGNCISLRTAADSRQKIEEEEEADFAWI